MFHEFSVYEGQLKLAAEQASHIKSLVPILVNYEDWLEWCNREEKDLTGLPVREYANFLFNMECRKVLDNACEANDQIIKSAYIAVTTSEIGLDKANDLSSLALIYEGIDSSSVIELVSDARIFHEHALALASAYAAAKNVSQVCWYRDRIYCWY
ncbi:hypothetical protein [Kordiimonas pumila]|uniref:Uncharacterized protein n=1 Tax=Kordiimonas pumila TaxID=2161677 RepID=A0ABV7D5A9_9PROT|nr:hypothetical protein [Kordiimonas pumila]